MDVKEELVTPEMAQAWLDTRTTNRSINNRRVNFLKEEMKNGHYSPWQPISFDSDGRLVDGQHRLSAVVDLGSPVKMVVMRGLPTDEFGAPIHERFDRGRAKRACDVLASRGVLSATNVASIASALISLDSGIRVSGKTVIQSMGIRGPRFLDVVLEMATKYGEEIAQACSALSPLNKNSVFHGGVLTPLRALWVRSRRFRGWSEELVLGVPLNSRGWRYRRTLEVQSLGIEQKLALAVVCAPGARAMSPPRPGVVRYDPKLDEVIFEQEQD